MCAAPEPGRSVFHARRCLRPRPSWLAAAAVALALPAPALAAPSKAPPTVRGCLAAWNDGRNTASRARLRALGVTWASLQPATVVRWEYGGSAEKTTRHEACSLHVVDRRRWIVATGVWRTARVRSWTFSSHARPRRQTEAQVNVRVLADGRLRLVVRRVRPLDP